MPSTTALAPEFLTQNRSPAIPFIYASPLVAPYRATFPVMIFKFDLNVDFQLKESNRLDIQIEYTPSNIPGVTALNQRIILFYLPVEYKLSQISSRYPSQTSRSKKIK